MMSLLKECRKRKKQDRLAREIAARHEMTAEYEAARKEGVSPIEVLKDWDMVTEEERKRLNETETDDRELTDSKFNRASTIISAIALVFAIFAAYFSYKATMKVSSKEYEMSQNMKNDLVEMMAALRSIDDKAALSKYEWREYDFTNEWQLLSDIQTRPGYLVFLYLLHNDSDRAEIEKGLKTLTGDYLVSKKASMTDIRSQAERIMKVLDYHHDLTSKDAIVFDTMLQFMLKARNYDAVEVGDVLREHDTRRKEFLEKLMREGFEDPNIRYYYYTFVVPDSALAHQAREAGAFPITYDSTSDLGLWEQWGVWREALWQCLENEYPVKYHEFLISR